MAEWKKLVTSGSNISQLNNDTGYLTSSSLANRNAFASASINGTILLANSPTGSLNFASSSGQGLNISGNAGTDTLTFGLNSIPNSSLLNSGSIIGSTVVNLGTTVTSIAGLTLTTAVVSGSLFGTASYASQALTASYANLAATASSVNTLNQDVRINGTLLVSGSDNGSTFIRFGDYPGGFNGSLQYETSTTNGQLIVNAPQGLKTSYLSVNQGMGEVFNVGFSNTIVYNTLIASGSSRLDAATGSFTGSFTGNGSGLTGVVSSSYANNATSASYALTASFALNANSDLAIAGTTGTGTVDLQTQTLTVAGTTNEITTNASGQTITIGLPTNVTIAGDLAVNGGDITTTALTASLFNSTATQVNIGGSALQMRIGNGAGTITIPGNLTVQGTTTTISSSVLEIADQFILLASGSNVDVDGGLIVQNAANGSGHAFGYGTPENRWVMQASLNSLSSSFASIDGYVTTTQYGLAGAKPANPSYGGATYGYGNIYTATDTGEIFIYA
jgi:hypothetical protein